MVEKEVSSEQLSELKKHIGILFFRPVKGGHMVKFEKSKLRVFNIITGNEPNKK